MRPEIRLQSALRAIHDVDESGLVRGVQIRLVMHLVLIRQMLTELVQDSLGVTRVRLHPDVCKRQRYSGLRNQPNPLSYLGEKKVGVSICSPNFFTYLPDSFRTVKGLKKGYT